MATQDFSHKEKTHSKLSAERVMAIVAFDCEGVVYSEFIAKGRTIATDAYFKTLQNLKKAIKDHGYGIIFLYDNADPM